MEQRNRATRANNVRIGPVSIITLIAVICMAVLAVLSVSTAHATMVISERQANATVELYRNECAAQEFVAGLDDLLAGKRAAGSDGAAAAGGIGTALDALCEQASAAADGQVEAQAEMDGQVVNATFTGAKMRQLDIAITILDDATYRIDKWKAAAVQHEAQSVGTLWSGA